MKTTKLTLLFLLALLGIPLPSLGQYEWPMESYKDVRGTFGEYRDDHFHEGIDISAPSQHSVWCTYDAFKLINATDGSYGYTITVQHYSIFGSETTAVDEGSRYLHLNSWENLNIGTVYLQDSFIGYNVTFWGTHLHFDFRKPAPTSANKKNPYNPMRIDTILCPDDDSLPKLIYLYVDGSTQHQGNATIECWNYLHFSFDSLYNDSIDSPFVRCDLPVSSPTNEIDDPHVLISGNRKVRFIVEAQDMVNDPNHPKCSPYEIHIYGDLAIDYPDDTNYTEYSVRFDSLIRSEGEDLDEEDIYHISQPCSSRIKQNPNDTTFFFYRLYPLDYNANGLPSCIISCDTLRTEDDEFEEGQHRIRVVAKDVETNPKDADLHFYIKKSSWLDFCHSFEE